MNDPSRIRYSVTFAVLTICLGGCQASEPTHNVPDFTLTERSGTSVTNADLRGKDWIAACVFTRCSGACPQITGVMARLHHELRDRPDVMLVSLSVDPDYDTPEVLRDYAAHQGASERWLFLTGSGITPLVRDGLKLNVRPREGAERTPGNEVDHSPRLTLVDRAGVIRGYYDATDPAKVDELMRDLPALLPVPFFPSLNASLNAACGVLLLAGYAAIRRRRITLHKVCMLAALAVSATFLGCYLYYHIVIRGGTPTYFTGPQPARTIYQIILISHTILATVVAPLAIYVAWQGMKDRLARHVRLARWTLPIWLYVSVTGVVVYWMLYHLYPSGG